MTSSICVEQVRDPVVVALARAPDQTVDLVALLEQVLGQIGAVLAVDPGDEGPLLLHGKGSIRDVGGEPLRLNSLAIANSELRIVSHEGRGIDIKSFDLQELIEVPGLGAAVLALTREEC